MYRYYIIFAFLFSLSKIQAQEPRMEHFGAEDGLPSTEVYQVFQDSKGYIWLGTDHGLARYDGYDFETFTTQDGLLDNTIFRIYEHRDTLWFLPYSNGVFFYDGIRFYPHPANDSIKKQKNTWVSALTFAKNGDIWGTYHNDRHSNQFLNLRLDKPFSIDTVKIFPDNESYLVVGKKIDDQLLCRPLADVNLERPLKFKTFNGYLFAKGELGGGLERFSPVSQKLDGNSFLYMGKELGILEGSEFTIHPASKDIVLTRMLADQQKFWLATLNKGLVIWDKNGPLTNLKEDLKITDVIQDRDLNYWFSTTENGVYKIPSIAFLSYGQKDGIISNRITHLCNINDELYFTTPESYVYKINKYQEIELLRKFEKNPKISKLFNLGDKLAIIARETRLENAYPDLLYGVTASLLSKDSFLLGKLNDLTIYKKKQLVKKLGDYFGMRTIATLRDKQNQIWSGTLEGLYRYEDGLMTPVKEHESYSTRVTDLKLHDATGKLFIGTKGRGILIREKPGEPVQITTKNGLNSDLIKCLFFENDTTLWVGSYEGLNKVILDPLTNYSLKHIEKYTKSSGLISDEINEIDKSQGKIWLATNKGLCFFLPSEIRETTAVPLVQFTKLIINNSKIQLDKDSSHVYSFSPDQNDIAIDYIGISTTDKVEYQYRMLGHDTTWLTTMGLNRPYTNLPAGRYTFELKARNKSGTAFSPTKRIYFDIERHYTKKWWFVTMVAFTLLTILGTIAYLVIRYNKLKSQKEHRVLISEQKALRSQMNPHFIFNAMNSIQYFIADNDKRNASIFLARFSSLIRKILDNSKHNFISLEDELSSIKAYLELEKLRFGEKFAYQINFAKNINRFELEIPAMMIQPFLENAIWHGLMPKGSNGMLELDFTIKDKILLCTITDDGIGRVAAGKISKKRGNHNSTGLKNVEERIKLINSLFKLEMSVAIDDLYDHQGQAKGTKVTITFPILEEK